MTGSRNVVEELKLIEESGSLSQPEGRRIAIRSAFAALEILVAELSAGLAERLPPADEKSHDERHRWFLELCALSNISYRITDKGQVKFERPNTPLKNRALLALNMCARVTGATLSPRHEEGWSEFLKATEIRNRITHPKTEQDLAVSMQEYETVRDALRWFVWCNHLASRGASNPIGMARRAHAKSS